MSTIKIKRRIDPIVRPYDVAKRIKQHWTGDGVEKAPRETILDLGDEFCGTYGQIDSIELNDKPRAPQLQPADDKPMTPEEKKAAREFFAEIREKMNWVKDKKVKKLTLTRSGLMQYKKKFGKDFVVQEGTEIIEDI